MKSPNEWDEDYLLNLPAIEPMKMDFKARKGLDLTLPTVNEEHVKTQLSVALSAFANSGGGLIIYGVKDPKPGEPLEIDDGGVDMTMKGRSTKEWLEDVIPYLTDFQIRGFEVHPVEGKATGSQIAPGRAVFVIEVPDSERAPHQARDNKYYIRAGSKSVPVGHQIVIDIAGRRQYPQIHLKFSIRSSWASINEEDWQALPRGENRQADLIVTMQNLGRVYAQYVNCLIYVPLKLVRDERLLEKIRIAKSSNGEDCYLLQINNSSTDTIGSVRYNPILPMLDLGHQERGLLANFSSRNGQPFGNELPELKLNWRVYADNAPLTEGSTLLKEIPVFSKNGEQIFPTI